MVLLLLSHGDETEALSSLDYAVAIFSCFHHLYDANIVPWHFPTTPLIGPRRPTPQWVPSAPSLLRDGGRRRELRWVDRLPIARPAIASQPGLILSPFEQGPS